MNDCVPYTFIKEYARSLEKDNRKLLFELMAQYETRKYYEETDLSKLTFDEVMTEIEEIMKGKGIERE